MTEHTLGSLLILVSNLVDAMWSGKPATQERKPLTPITTEQSALLAKMASAGGFNGVLDRDICALCNAAVMFAALTRATE